MKCDGGGNVSFVLFKIKFITEAGGHNRRGFCAGMRYSMRKKRKAKARNSVKVALRYNVIYSGVARRELFGDNSDPCSVVKGEELENFFLFASRWFIFS